MEESLDEVETKTFFGRCICCMEYGYMKNMWIEHYWEGEREIYGEMLMETFSIVCNQLEKLEQICEVCVTRLRDAFNFKKDVQASLNLLQEDSFYNEGSDTELQEKKMFQDNQSLEEEYLEEDMEQEVKLEHLSEPEYQEIEYLEEDEALVAAEITKSQSTESTPASKCTKKERKGDVKATYKNYNQADLRRAVEAVINNELTVVEASERYCIPRRTINTRITYLKNRPDERESPERLTNKETRAKRGEEIRKQLANIRTILEYTNATPFAGQGGTKYTCYFCREDFTKPADLKRHTRKLHSDGIDAFRVGLIQTSEFILKLDITGLNCKLCYSDVDSLENLYVHLRAHKKTIYTEINHLILPFNFADEVYRCVVCKNEFLFFKLLLNHMIEHYSNFSCSICDKGFINKRTLSYHVARHEMGTYKCSQCPKVFLTHVSKMNHERVLHRKLHKTRQCRYCEEKFVNDVQRNKHEVKSHGADPEVYPCKDCEKAFNCPFALTKHVNRCHLKLKREKCTVCDKRFFEKKGLRNHMLKHTKERLFKCDVCLKSYSRKYTLREHMRIHNNDRRFRCELCGQTFIQKCSLQGHLKNRHNFI